MFLVGHLRLGLISLHVRVGFLLQSIKVTFPFHGKKLLFLVVTIFTGRHNVTFGAFTTSCKGNNVVHGKFGGGCWLTTIITKALGAAAFPPLAVAQLAGLVALGPDLGGIKVVGIWCQSVFHGGLV